MASMERIISIASGMNFSLPEDSPTTAQHSRVRPQSASSAAPRAWVSSCLRMGMTLS